MKLTYTDDNWCWLTIHSCLTSDTGTYLCSATNVVGSQASQCTLTVTGGEEGQVAGAKPKKVVKKKQAPKFVKTPSNQIELLQGQTVELLCKVVANPPAKLNWLKNQKAVSLDLNTAQLWFCVRQ